MFNKQEYHKKYMKFYRIELKERNLCVFSCGRKSKAGWKVCPHCRLLAWCKKQRGGR